MSKKNHTLVLVLSSLLLSAQAYANRAEVVEYDPSVRTQPPKVMEADTGIIGYVNDKVANIERRTEENGDRLDRIANDVDKLKQLESRVAALEAQLATLKTADRAAINGADETQKPLMSAEEMEAAQHDYKQAFDQLMASNYGEAAKLFKQYVDKYPHSDQLGNAYYWYGETQFVTRKYDNALKAYVSSTEAGGPKEGDALLKQAECYIELKKVKEAKTVLEMAKQRFANTDTAKKADKLLSSLKK